MVGREEEGLLEILLAAAEAEDAGNLVGLRGEEGLSPTPTDDLSHRTAEVIPQALLPAAEAPPLTAHLSGCDADLLCSFISSILKQDREPYWWSCCEAPATQQQAAEWSWFWFWSRSQYLSAPAVVARRPFKALSLSP